MSEANTVVTIAMLKEQLNVTGTAHDAKLQRIIARAEATAFDYIGKREGVGEFYTDFGESGLLVLELAVLVLATMIYEHPDDNPLSEAVKALLRRFRDPVLAV